MGIHSSNVHSIFKTFYVRSIILYQLNININMYIYEFNYSTFTVTLYILRIAKTGQRKLFNILTLRELCSKMRAFVFVIVLLNNIKNKSSRRKVIFVLCTYYLTTQTLFYGDVSLIRKNSNSR